MKIAVTSQNFQTITPHAGKTRRFLVYESIEGSEPVEIDRLDLPKEMAIHEFHGDGPHPLDAMDLVVAGSYGEGFAARMAARGITIVATDHTDPVTAVKDYVARIRSGEEIRTGPGACGHGHGHEHGHDHPEHRPGAGPMHRGFRVLEGAPPAKEASDD